MRRPWVVASLLTCTAFAPGRLAAQHDSALVQAVRLATEGMGDSARALIRERLQGLAPGDSSYPEVLFTAGLVAGQGDTALAYFRRVSVEFSQSDWADDALLRIAQLAFAGGDLAAARRTTERILSDYPLSDVRAQAAFWSGRAALETGDAGAGCQRLAEAKANAGEAVELANQAAFYLQRCAAVAPVTPASAPTGGAGGRDTTRKDSAAPTPPARTFYAVQVAAVRSATAADEVMRSLIRQGYAARVIRDPDGLLKVRVGHAATRAEADRLARELKSKMGGTPFVVEET